MLKTSPIILLFTPVLTLDREPGLLGDSATTSAQVADELRGLAAIHAGDSKLKLLRGADFVDFQGKKIDLLSHHIDLLGMENEELRAQIARVQNSLSGLREFLETMPDQDRACFKALQTFVLDVMDIIGTEGEDSDGAADGGTPSPSVQAPPAAASLECAAAAAAEPPAARPPSKAEREGAQVQEILTRVYRLQNQGKMSEAEALRATIPKGKLLGASALNKAAVALERRLFSIGGYASIEALVDRLVSRPLVRQVSR